MKAESTPDLTLLAIAAYEAIREAVRKGELDAAEGWIDKTKEEQTPGT